MTRNTVFTKIVRKTHQVMDCYSLSQSKTENSGKWYLILRVTIFLYSMAQFSINYKALRKERRPSARNNIN